MYTKNLIKTGYWSHIIFIETMAITHFKSGIIALLLLFPFSFITANCVQQANSNNFDKANSFVHKQMKNSIISNKTEITKLKKDLEYSNYKVDSLKKRINYLRKEAQIYHTANQEEIKANNTSIQSLNNLIIDRSKIYGTTMSIVIVFLILIIFILKKKLTSIKCSLKEAQEAQSNLYDGQKAIEDGTATLNNKVTYLLDKQLSITKQVTSQDHSLALKVADEIVRIETNLYRMDPTTRGYKQLTRSIQRMKDCFMTKGYEISDLLGKPYNEGMKIVANFIIDESLPEGKAIITGIIKPQIIYNGKMIQAAQITVSQNI